MVPFIPNYDVYATRNEELLFGSQVLEGQFQTIFVTSDIGLVQCYKNFDAFSGRNITVIALWSCSETIIIILLLLMRKRTK